MAVMVTAMSRVRTVCCTLASLGSSLRLMATGKHLSSHPWGDNTTESDLEPEDPDPTSIISRTLKKQRKAVLFQRMKRKMEPGGPPERALTWKAIEQIRYLKQEFPEEWTVPRLAQGFNTSTDAIRRLLRSKFSPSEKRKAKQDAKVSFLLNQMNKTSTKHLLAPISTATESGQALLPTVVTPGQSLLSSGMNEKPITNTQEFGVLTSTGTISDLVNPTSLELAFVKVDQINMTKSQVTNKVQGTMFASMESTKSDNPHSTEDEKICPDEEWDGQILCDGELEELSRHGIENKMKVVQKGREFFDSNGNFLYRI
ncbi:hypothetical protein GDO86_006388 [Hymenochirus boettgeri]|uniref:Neugrin n=1 Tax=Hymenochirus boettgeri TaxID=247094 RepID=A0A8T2J5X5_9PIPI|nr:hypothetical protein GDO86_006388 [Hymenochirus boettgeri]KAG8440619.1 hypothetical protein GDO86_006388 [Hymenochirus boettgeri]